MAANLGQAFMGGGGMIPSLAQELASNNFHENRESFHDYIYSKLILGEDKGGNPNAPVFPTTNMSNYASHLPAPSASVGSFQPNASTTGGINAASAFIGVGVLGSVPKSSGGSKKNTAGPAPQNQQNIQQGQHLGQSQSQNSIQSQSGMSNAPGGEVSPPKVKKKSHKKKEKTNVCDVCHRAFAEKYTLNRHMFTHTNIKPYSCTKCNMAFSRSDGLAKHMAAGHRRIDAHHCDVCGGTFNSEVSYEQHRREYGSTLPFVCNLCMLAFSQCCHLNYHMKTHSLNKLNDEVMAQMEDNKDEVIDVSELIPEDFSPPKNSRKPSINSLSSFNFSALNSGSGKGLDPNIVIKPEVTEPSPCSGGNQRELSGNGPGGLGNSFDISNLASTASSSLATSAGGSGFLSDGLSGTISDMDMKKYFDIKVPNPKFMSPTGGQNPNAEDGLFRCPLCGKGFTRKYHMQRHVKLHTRGPVPKAHLLDWTRRPYACGVCKMGFTRQHHLTRHMLIHTGERPHACHICGKAFRRFTNLSLHVRTVHGSERPFKCTICGRGFPRVYSLQRHLLLHGKEAAAKSATAAAAAHKTTAAGGKESDFGKNSARSPGHESVSSGMSEEDEIEMHLNQQASKEVRELGTVDLTLNRNESSTPNVQRKENGEGFSNTSSQNVFPDQVQGLEQRRENMNQQQNVVHNQNLDRFNQQNLLQNRSAEQFHTLASQNVANMEMAQGRNSYDDVNVQGSPNYPINPRRAGEGFANNSRPPSQHMIMEREARSEMENQFTQGQHAFPQQGAGGSMDLSSHRSTPSESALREPQSFNQLMELPPGHIFQHSQSGNGLAFPGNPGAFHPHPSSSDLSRLDIPGRQPMGPLPVTSQSSSNNLPQY